MSGSELAVLWLGLGSRTLLVLPRSWFMWHRFLF